MDMPPASFPVIPVHFFCVVDGHPQRPVRASCASVPRIGEVVFPEKGSPYLVVDLVIYEAQSLPGEGATMIPRVILREPTEEEKIRFETIVQDS